MCTIEEQARDHRRQQRPRAPAKPPGSTETLRFEHGGFSYYASLGRFADGRLAEVFLSGPKVGTDVSFAARDASIMCSIALQYGVPVEVLRHAIGRNSDGTAAGPLGKLLDLLAKEPGFRSAGT